MLYVWHNLLLLGHDLISLTHHANCFYLTWLHPFLTAPGRFCLAYILTTWSQTFRALFNYWQVTVWFIVPYIQLLTTKHSKKIYKNFLPGLINGKWNSTSINVVSCCSCNCPNTAIKVNSYTHCQVKFSRSLSNNLL